MGTMQLPGSTPERPYYGHGGATYGFYSYVGYSPVQDFALAVSTNLELDGYMTYQNLNDIHGSVYAAVQEAFTTADQHQRVEHIVV